MRQQGNVTAFYSYHDAFSNHYLADIIVKGKLFNSVEQFFMYTKAMYFGDRKIADKIMAAESCQYQKMLGRDVKPFDKLKWERVNRHYMYIGQRAKVHQHPEVRNLLISTHDTIIVEASKKDTYWGAGIDIEDERIWDPKQWRGNNYAGRTLMRIRGELLNEHAEQTSQAASNTRIAA